MSLRPHHVHRAPRFRLPRAILGATLALVVSCGPDVTGPMVDPVARPLAVLRGQEAFLVSATGDDAVQLTNASDVQIEWLGWSPNGEEIAFVGAPAGDFRELWAMNADGSAPRVLSIVSGPVDRHVSWSPDGERLLFSAWSNTYVVTRDGYTQANLTPPNGGADSPTWSPDGEWIAYQGVEEDGRTGIFRMRADGTERTQLVELDSFIPNRSVRYAPAGDLIAYENLSDIWTVDEDGTDVTPLTSSPSSGDDTPVWSPDGTHLAFRTDGGAYFDIAIMEVASGAIVSQKTGPGGDLSMATWSPDGTRIAFRLGSPDLAVGPVDDPAAWDFLTDGTFLSWHPGG